MKLLAKERKYLLKELEADLFWATQPTSAMVQQYLDIPNPDDSYRKYHERREKARANKAKLVQGIIAKINSTDGHK